jgi:hypothetical protein
VGQQPNLFANPFFASLIKHTPFVINGAPTGLPGRLVVSNPVPHTISTSGSGAMATAMFMWTNLMDSWLMFLVKEWGSHALAKINAPG